MARQPCRVAGVGHSWSALVAELLHLSGIHPLESLDLFLLVLDACLELLDAVFDYLIIRVVVVVVLVGAGHCRGLLKSG